MISQSYRELPIQSSPREKGCCCFDMRVTHGLRVAEIVAAGLSRHIWCWPQPGTRYVLTICFSDGLGLYTDIPKGVHHGEQVFVKGTETSPLDNLVSAGVPGILAPQVHSSRRSNCSAHICCCGSAPPPLACAAIPGGS
jgi:hypothetical protein